MQLRWFSCGRGVSLLWSLKGTKSYKLVAHLRSYQPHSCRAKDAEECTSVSFVAIENIFCLECKAQNELGTLNSLLPFDNPINEKTEKKTRKN